MSMNRLPLLLCTSSSTRSPQIKPLIIYPLFKPLFKKYSQHKGGEEELIHMERAQSTEEVMKKLGEEKEEEAERKLEEKSHEGFVSQTSEKMVDAAQEAVGGDASPEDIKDKYKEAGPGETYHKPRDDGGVGPTSI